MTAEYPLSYRQSGLWFLSKVVPNSPAYNIAWGLRLRGGLDVPAFRRAVVRVMDRHEPLRTRFVTVGDQAVQRVSGVPGSAVAVETCTGDLALTRAAELAAAPFDLERDVPVRATVLELDRDDHLVVFVVHHIAFDGWSSRILEQELAECYRADVAGDQPRLPALPMSYGQYVAWQTDHEQGQVTADIEYWRAQLADIRPLGLREDLPRPAAPTFRGARETFDLPVGLFDKVATVARESRTTPYTVFLAALAALLFRFSGNGDVVVGSSALGRRHPQAAGLIGYFVDSLVMRVPVSPNDSFRDVLHRAKQVAIAAQEHDRVPFDLLVKQLRPPRDLSRNPFFQINLNYLDDAITEPVDMPGLVARPIELPATASRFDMSFSIIKRPDSVECGIDYSTDLYRPRTIQQYASSFRALLAAAAGAPDTRVAELALMSSTERDQVLAFGRSTS